MTNSERNDLIKELLSDFSDSENVDLGEEMIRTCLSLIKDDAARIDFKLLNKSFKEFRYAFKIFSGYRHLRKVSVFGSARSKPESAEYKHAMEFSEMIADRGFMVITGAGPGIMQAGNEGAGRDRSFGLNIRLPFEQTANEFIIGDEKLVTFRYFFTRKLLFLKETNALACFPGGFGTMDEAFESLTLVQTGKSNLMPIVLVDVPGGDYWQRWERFVRQELLDNGLISEGDLNLFSVTDSLEDACDEISRFYGVFHSKRFVGDRLVMRLKSNPGQAFADDLTFEFDDLLSEGGFRIHEGALSEEEDASELRHLPRLVFKTDSWDVGRFRTLIDRVNEQA
ncbi:MAG: LOG family protein [Planctomycetota bacterium]|nr:LOG family protein [Planctomycetota bacterium]